MIHNVSNEQMPVAPTYLTTKEVADLLRVKERKVYDLAAADEIPHRRITGKLLFPQEEILAWIEGSGTVTPRARALVVAGSHDPLLDWAMRESGAGLATLFNGSGAGLDHFEAAEAAVSGLHIPEKGGWNVQSVASRGLSDCVLLGWVTRSRGLILSEPLRGKVSAFADLRGHRVVMRQDGAGAAVLFDTLLARDGLSVADFAVGTGLARTENDAAVAVAAAEADAALGIAATAAQFSLPFVPLLDEKFDLLIDRRAYFSAPVQTFVKFCHSTAFVEKAALMGGYDLSEMGTVRWLSP